MIGARENQPTVVVLEGVDIIGLKQPADDDLAHFDWNCARRRRSQYGLGNDWREGAGRVGERSCRDNLAMTAVYHGEAPDIEPVGTNAARASADHRAAFG